MWLYFRAYGSRQGLEHLPSLKRNCTLLYEFIESYCAPTRTPPTAVEGALESGRNSVRARVGASSESGRSNPVNARKDGDF